jgi:hypothetical protein
MEPTPIQGKMNVEIRADATPLVQATANAISSVHKGLAKIHNALFGKWIAQSERSIALLQAQTQKDCADINAGTKIYREGMLSDCPDPKTVVDVYDALHTLNHVADARRLQAAVEEAARQISDVPPEEISDEPITQTFFNRWRREAEMIDEDDLRRFWASLLVEEAKKPNSISPRTLNVARNLSREEARLFENMAKYVCNGALFVNRRKAPPVGQYVDLLKLINAGLVGSQLSRQELKGTTGTQDDGLHAEVLFEEDGFLIQCGGERIRFSGHLLTNEGLELMNLLPLRRTQEDIVNIAKAIADQNTYRWVSVHVLTNVSHFPQGKTQYRYLSEPIWTTKRPEQ